MSPDRHTRGTGACSRRRSRARFVALVVGLCLPLVACGNGGPDQPTPSLTRTARPSATLPEPSRSPGESQPGGTGEPTPTALPTPSLTPTELPTPTPTSPTPTSPATGSSDEGSTDEGTEVPTWVWWLLGLVLLGLVVAVPLILRSRRRSAWATELAGASEDVVWFARVLLPELQAAATVDQVAGGWGVGLPRVTAVQDQLTGLEATARTDQDRAHAVRLRDAVRTSRDRIDRLVAARSPGPFSQELAGVAATLEAALAGPSSTRAG